MTWRDLVTHIRLPHDVYVGRPGPYGNPFRADGGQPRPDVLARYAAWLLRQDTLVAQVRQELPGKVLACWCSPRRCHAESLAQLANPDDVPPEFIRADGDVRCRVCRMEYRRHRGYLAALSYDGGPFLTELCDGRLVKL